jgi:hypothetical protein
MRSWRSHKNRRHHLKRCDGGAVGVDEPREPLAWVDIASNAGRLVGPAPSPHAAAQLGCIAYADLLPAVLSIPRNYAMTILDTCVTLVREVRGPTEAIC